jgi:hypothetical protein
VLFSSSLFPPGRLPSTPLGARVAGVWSNRTAVKAYPAPTAPAPQYPRQTAPQGHKANSPGGAPCKLAKTRHGQMMFVLKKKVRLCSAQSTMPTAPPDGKALRLGAQGDLNLWQKVACPEPVRPQMY